MRSLRKEATLKEEAQGTLMHCTYGCCWSCGRPGFHHVTVVQETEVEQHRVGGGVTLV